MDKFSDASQEKKLWDVLSKYRDTRSVSTIEDIIEIANEEGISLNWRQVASLIETQIPFYARNFVILPVWVTEFILEYYSKKRRRFKQAWDPWAGIGLHLLPFVEAGITETAVGWVQIGEAYSTAKILSLPFENNLNWRIVNPLSEIEMAKGQYDFITSILPMGLRENSIRDRRFKNDAGLYLLLESLKHLTDGGEALFTVSELFFTKQIGGKTMPEILENKGYHISNILHLAPAEFGVNSTGILMNFIQIDRKRHPKWFVAKLSLEEDHRRKLMAHLLKRKNGPSVSLGRLIDPTQFRGYRSLEARENATRLAKGIKDVQQYFLVDIVRIDADGKPLIRAGSRKKDHPFEDIPNAIYIPKTGFRSVVADLSKTESSPHWIQVALDPQKAMAEYVALFLNTDLGIMLRKEVATGGVIPNLNLKRIPELRVFLPARQVQHEVIEVHGRIRELVTSLDELEDHLWEQPMDYDKIESKLAVLGQKDVFLDWIETLPAPLASILWTYHAHQETDKEQYERLLHFFEALAEFTATILLSAARNDDAYWETHREKINIVLERQNLSLKRATFGTWRVIVEILSSSFRALLNSKQEEDHALLRKLFRTDNERLIASICSTQIVQAIQTANSWRNDWLGHVGMVTNEDARERHTLSKDLLLTIRESYGRIWTRYQLILPKSSRYRNGIYHYQVEFVVGTRVPFGAGELEIKHPLNDETLHLYAPDTAEALELIPFIKVLSSPKDVKMTCYFYNRLDEKNGARLIAYSLASESEIKKSFSDIADMVRQFEKEQL